MTEYPAPPQYPVHIPPHQQYIPASMQTVETTTTPKPRGRRRSKAPASTTKLHRPLTRFYCNDCKKKFRSRILANRNNNAVQHYCSLYQKIITRKVDSHSNKCRGDHGMGPCVVKRVDQDPDSDGEDETKAAYYADKGKGRRGPNKTPTASKRKLDDRGAVDPSMAYKRQRTNENDVLALPPSVEIAPTLQYAQPATTYDYPPPPEQPAYHGLYHRNGYMTQPSHNGYHHNAPPYLEEELPPPLPTAHNGYDELDNDLSMPPPPIIDTQSDQQHSVSPCIPMPIAIGDDSAARGTEDGLVLIPCHEDDDDAPPPPPPPLELFDADKKAKTNADMNCVNGVGEEMAIKQEVNNTSDCLVTPSPQQNAEKRIKVEMRDEEQQMVGTQLQNGQHPDGVNASGDEEEEEDDELPTLKIAGSSPSPRAKQKKNTVGDGAEAKEIEDEDYDLTLTPQ